MLCRSAQTGLLVAVLTYAQHLDIVLGNYPCSVLINLRMVHSASHWPKDRPRVAAQTEGAGKRCRQEQAKHAHTWRDGREKGISALPAGALEDLG